MRGSLALLFLIVIFLAGTALATPPDYNHLAVEITGTFFDRDFFADKPLDAVKWRDLFWQEIGYYHPGIPAATIAASLPSFQNGEDFLRRGQIDFARQLTIDAHAPVSDSILFSALINGWLKGRDKYGLWQTAGDSHQWDTFLSGRLRGIGVRWAEQRGSEGYLIVEMVVPRTAADEAGVKPGLEVTGLLIDGQTIDLPSTRGADLAARIGTAQQVVLQTAQKTYSLTPREILFQEAQIHLDKEKGAPILHIPHFDRGAAARCAELLGPVAQSPTLILDLRDCGGGYTDEAGALLGMLIGPGPIGVTWKYRDEVGRIRKKPMESQAAQLWQGKKLIVRVNGETASAAELMVMALRPRPSVIIEGGPTYGKTTSQDLLRLSGDSQLRVSVSQFGPEPGLIGKE